MPPALARRINPRRPTAVLLACWLIQPPALASGQVAGAPGHATIGEAVAQQLAAGDSLGAALQPEAALARYRAALALDSTDYAALWKAGGALIDVAKQMVGTTDAERRTRDSLYGEAQAYARAAIRSDSAGANGYFMLAQAAGRLARTQSPHDRVRLARVIYDAAARAVTLDPRHDGAWHVLGAWHAEVKRLPGLTRTFARTFLGGGILGRARWDSATAYLERAVQLRPGYITHRLELARIYLDRDRLADAREQLTAIATLPIADVLDRQNQAEAVSLLASLDRRCRKHPSQCRSGDRSGAPPG